MDKKRIALLIQEVNKKHGDGTIWTLGSKQGGEGIPRTPTGIEDLDKITGGGLPLGRLVELYGPESSGKTSLAFHLAARYELALFIDAEGTFDTERAKMFGNKKGQLLVRRPAWGEQAFELLLQFAEAGCPLIIIDSVPAMIPRKEYEQDDMEKQTMGLVAGMLSRKLPKLAHVCDNSGTTVLFINQVRDTFNAMPWGEQTHTPGGRALKHYVSIRMQIARKQWIKHEKLGNFGQICKVRITKSKVCNPYGEAELPLILSKGFVRHEEVATVRTEMLKELKAAGKDKLAEEEVQPETEVAEAVEE